MKITKERLKQIIKEEIKSDPALLDAIEKLTDSIEELDVSIDFLSSAATGESGISIGAAQRQLGRAYKPKVRVARAPMQETLDEQGGHGPPTVKDIEGMLPAGVKDNTPGVASVLQRRALEAKMSKNDLAAKIKAAKIKDGEHPRQFFKRLGFKY
jgi:hypothetical protein